MKESKSSFGGTMKTNTHNILTTTFGLISITLLIAGAIAWWNSNFSSFGMSRNHSIMSLGTNLWIFLIIVIGVVLLIGFGVISLAKPTADQNGIEMPLCPECGEEIMDPDLEFCQLCGEPIESL
jgi:FtsH-binding integral membrane protein